VDPTGPYGTYGSSGSSGPSDKSRGVALALAIVLGVFGAHRFYTGKIGTALLQLVTLGGLGIWYLYDVILIGAGQFRDADDRLVRLWDPQMPDALRSGVPEGVLDELHALRADVEELAERMDFTERLLSQSRPETLGPGHVSEYRTPS
jgi:hypothetical protein